MISRKDYMLGARVPEGSQGPKNLRAVLSEEMIEATVAAGGEAPKEWVVPFDVFKKLVEEPSGPHWVEHKGRPAISVAGVPVCCDASDDEALIMATLSGEL